MTNSNFAPDNFEPQLVIPEEGLSEKSNINSRPIVSFQTYFTGIMEMYADEKTVCEYLNEHQGWFIRCAKPMKAIPYGENGYTLIVGNYGALGYYVEPQMSVIIEPPHSKRYAMYSVNNPQIEHPGYEVNYRSDLEIESIPVSLAAKGIEKVFRKHTQAKLPEQITKINWQLNLKVKVQFPAFIYRLPMSMIESTGNRLLTQIVKQVSPSLSHKVQKDFHSRMNLPIPPASSRTCLATKAKLS